MTWLSSVAPGLPAEETIDGVRIVRRGSELTTRLSAPGLVRRLRPDVVLEEINTLPYLAPLWTRRPVVLYMNQLARDVWWYEAPRAVAALGWTIEPVYLQTYRRSPVITISESSRDTLRRVFGGREITVVPLAVDTPAVDAPPPKRRTGSLIAIGRLTPSKRYDHAIEALRELVRSHPEARLRLIGGGRDQERLVAHARSLEVLDRVEFHGRVSEEEKLRLLDDSDVLVGTSVREGWGLTVTEAAARATPSVVYDIPGFRDAVLDRRTGLVVPPSPHALAAGVAQLVDDEELYDRLRTEAWTRTKAMTHDMTADAFEAVLRAAAG